MLEVADLFNIFAVGNLFGTMASVEGPSLGVFLFYDSVELLKAFFMDFNFDVPFLSFVRELVTVIAHDFAFFLLFEVFPVDDE